MVPWKRTDDWGKPGAFSGEEYTRKDWSSQVRAFVLKKHADARQPSESVSRKRGHTAQVPPCHADHGTSAADHPTTFRRSAKPSDTLHEGTTRGTQARSLAKLQKIMRFDFGQNLAMVTE